MSKKGSLIFVLLLAVISCKKIMPPAPSEDELLDGPADDLTSAEIKQFLSGDAAFNNDIFTPKNGLGPVFVSNSCGSCHAGDGKGHPFSMLTRFGQTDSSGNHFLNLGGPQLQNRSIPGYHAEELPDGIGFSNILAPANSGLGFLDAITDSAILAMADVNDLDNDGISGAPNWIKVPDYCKLRDNAVTVNGKYIGRFGKKAAVYDLLQQTANAYNQDMGINTSFEPYDTYSGLEVEPEISNTTVYNVVFYLKTLKAPIQRYGNNEVVQAGKRLFINAGCTKCHKDGLKTGFSPINALSYKIIHPYTDLLLHDMGKALDDNYTEGNATTSEWRTPALWGLGLSMNSQGGSFFLMHDGRAHSIEEAILLHEGEAHQSNENYRNLSTDDKQKIIKFLESL